MQNLETAKAAFNAWMEAPIPRKHVIAASSIMALGHGMSILGGYIQIKSLNRQHKRDVRAINILKESNDFLLERAAGSDLAELNEKLDFWRQILDMPPRPERVPVVEDDGHMNWCERTSCKKLTSTLNEPVNLCVDFHQRHPKESS